MATYIRGAPSVEDVATGNPIQGVEVHVEAVGGLPTDTGDGVTDQFGSTLINFEIGFPAIDRVVISFSKLGYDSLAYERTLEWITAGGDDVGEFGQELFSMSAS